MVKGTSSSLDQPELKFSLGLWIPWQWYTIPCPPTLNSGRNCFTYISLFSLTINIFLYSFAYFFVCAGLPFKLASSSVCSIVWFTTWAGLTRLEEPIHPNDILRATPEADASSEVNKSHMTPSMIFSFNLKNSNQVVHSLDNTHTSFSAGDPMEEMRSIDRDITRLEESIRALKFRRNELSLFSRPPAEILCNIFSLIDDDIFSSGQSSKFWTNFNFSQVSQYWRSTALSAPELRSKIWRWIQEMLIRSKMVKLTIRSGSSFDILNLKAIETVRSCLYEMGRVEKLELTAIPGFKLEEIFRDLHKSAPQLHTLCIGGSTTFSIHEDFLHEAERLQRVELSNCNISWDSQLLTGLTYLSLQQSLNANSSITQILRALQRMPGLTYLHLVDSIPDDSELLSTYPVVELPCLRELCISSDIGALTTVLRHITIPHSTILDLTCRENQSTQIDFSSFLSVLVTKFLSSLVIRCLSFQFLDNIYTEIYGLGFYLWTNAIEDCFPSPLISQSQIRLLLTWHSLYIHNHADVLICAFDAMSLPFLTQLQISTLDNIDSLTWVKTFGKLPLLNRVCVQGSIPRSFFEALVYKTQAAEKSETAYRNVSFPRLRHIDLEGADFCTTHSESISVDNLLDCFAERCERRAETLVLSLRGCYYISSSDVERLKEVVDVIWDGISHEYWKFGDKDWHYISDLVWSLDVLISLTLTYNWNWNEI